MDSFTSHFSIASVFSEPATESSTTPVDSDVGGGGGYCTISCIASHLYSIKHSIHLFRSSPVFPSPHLDERRKNGQHNSFGKPICYSLRLYFFGVVLPAIVSFLEGLVYDSNTILIIKVEVVLNYSNTEIVLILPYPIRKSDHAAVRTHARALKLRHRHRAALLRKYHSRLGNLLFNRRHSAISHVASGGAEPSEETETERAPTRVEGGIIVVRVDVARSSASGLAIVGLFLASEGERGDLVMELLGARASKAVSLGTSGTSGRACAAVPLTLEIDLGKLSEVRTQIDALIELERTFAAVGAGVPTDLKPTPLDWPCQGSYCFENDKENNKHEVMI
ncbi:hypothetical protein V8E53_004094 [Lactarius tabidus]